VAKRDVLARVKVDLTLGRAHLARQRLRTLLAIDPDDLEVRELLAAVYRQTGNVVEAGRWAYLSPQLRPEELIAFERAHPSPWLRLRLLRFTGDVADLSPAARQRLRMLAAQATRAGPPPVWQRQRAQQQSARRRGSAVPCLFVAVSMVVLGALVAIGIYRIVHWIVNF
jgi:cytochrome c-type biogenesis protein CcmH/NrfG